MDEKTLKLAIGKKISTIAYNENLSIDDVKKRFCVEGTCQEQYDKLFEYVKEKAYKAKRASKEKKETEIEIKEIQLDANAINDIINGKGTDSEKINKIKEIIDKIIERNEIIELKEKIENQKKNLELYEKELSDKLNKLR